MPLAAYAFVFALWARAAQAEGFQMGRGSASPADVQERPASPVPELGEPLSTAPQDGWKSIIPGIALVTAAGSATVRSHVAVSGARREVAKGNAATLRARVELAVPPPSQGFYWFVVPGITWEKFTIADFAEEIPETTVANSENIPYVETDFETGKKIEGADPNTYRIELSFLDLQPEVGYRLTMKCRPGTRCWYMQWNLSGSLVGWLERDVTLGARRASSDGFEFFQGGSFQYTLGFYLPRIHSRWELVVSKYEYPGIRLPDRLEFRDRVKFNSEKQVFERRRVFVDKVSVSGMKASFSYGYIF